MLFRSHLEKHKPDVYTSLLYESDDLEDFNDVCRAYSEYFDVVEDDQWANLIPEHGYDAPPLRDKVKEYWQKLPPGKLEEISRIRSDFQIERWKTLPAEERRKHSESVSNGRKSMTDDARKSRADKMYKNFHRNDDGSYANPKVGAMIEKFKLERKSGANPSAKRVMFLGVEYQCISDVSLVNPEYSVNKVMKMLNDASITNCYYIDKKREFQPLTCPHCGKEGDTSSSFKRWHMNNCRNKSQ